ncbi:uncharacterized protein H6S33_010592 [Morchella sextelata]|uniref:uncharacterized protein n=1 Tax=Morchella sextelata TaxID=1174677 RepID=UPI001D04EA80|nr:uncharacterized protein H6S33_010592 [Morchella sextelata]KAH0611327.1 hypothetical protein H6S33_010592 [Morchella sextelata]
MRRSVAIVIHRNNDNKRRNSDEIFMRMYNHHINSRTSEDFVEERELELEEKVEVEVEDEEVEGLKDDIRDPHLFYHRKSRGKTTTPTTNESKTRIHPLTNQHPSHTKTNPTQTQPMGV